jgi:biotin transport system substrate-specific component
MSNVSDLAIAKSFAHPRKVVLSQILWITFFAAATAAGARLEIPHEPVPFTLQTMMVLLAGAFLGPRNGAFSQLLYLAAGGIGFPVFAGGGVGAATLIGPTGGYLLAFPLGAAIVGWVLAQQRSLIWIAAAMTAGLFVIFAAGTLHLYLFWLHDTRVAFTSGFLLFTWWDLLKLGAAAMIYRELSKRWSRLP